MSDSIVQSFRRLAALRGPEEALRERNGGRSWTFADLERSLDARAGRLREGVGGRLVGLATGNRGSFIELFLALRAAEIPVLLLDAGLPQEEKLRLCRQMGVLGVLHADPDEGEEWEPGVFWSRLDAPPVELPEGTALVKLTSGSTGEPKGACFDETSLLIGIRQIGEAMSLDERDRVLLVIPLSHSYGFDNGVLSLAVLGTPLVLENRFFPGSILRALDEERATFLPLVPPLVRSLGGADWPEGLALRTVICAGGKLRPETAEAFERVSGRRVHDFYGSTETGGICFERSPHDPGSQGTVGRPLPGVDLEISEDGNLVVHSGANLIGIVGSPTAPEQRDVVMGDIARIEADGRVRLLGRTANVLNIGGRKVPASRIEAVLRDCPGVVDVAVVGVDDAVRGDRTVGFFVAETWPLDLGSVETRSIPREVRRIDALPFTDRGKLDRATLRRWAIAGGDRTTIPEPDSSSCV